MPVLFIDTKAFDKKIPAVVVCAGTVTCSTVAGMGSGFAMFKALFKENLHVEGQVGGWQAALQQLLDNFHKKNDKMPAYVRIAKQGALIGGISTVPVKSGRGLTDDEKNQYKSAVRLAVIDAGVLNLPLVIQPLGIGVYGWPPVIAAQLFFDAIAEADPEGRVDITIPLFDQKAGSNDLLFKAAFLARATPQVNTASAEIPPKPQAKKVPVVVTPKPQTPIEINDEPLSPVGESVPQKLSKIIDTLINNIETKQHGRCTSGKNSTKVRLLKELQKSLSEKSEAESICDIRSICNIKRNPLHFWKTPDSVEEFEQLLKDNDIIEAKSPISPRSE